MKFYQYLLPNVYYNNIKILTRFICCSWIQSVLELACLLTYWNRSVSMITTITSILLGAIFSKMLWMVSALYKKTFRENWKNRRKIGVILLFTFICWHRTNSLCLFFIICRWLDDMISQPVSVTYNAATNYVIVPSPVLQQPYFEKDYPL